jgi:hypothetical protein
MQVTWTQLRNFSNTKKLPIQWIDLDDGYTLKVFDGFFELECTLAKDGNADVAEFEATYKLTLPAATLSSSVQSTPAFTSKTIQVGTATKKLYARNTGMQFAVTTGANTLTYTATYAWAKILGVECIGAESLDTVDMKVYDTSTGTYSGVPNYMLNQFAYSVNIGKDYYVRLSQFDADLYVGMIIQFTYTSVSNKTIGFNLIMNEVKS